MKRSSLSKDIPWGARGEVAGNLADWSCGDERAARVLARRFDEAPRSLGLTSGQFSLLDSLNRPEPSAIGPVAHLLAIDQTTLPAALKPLERDGPVSVTSDPHDRRSRRLRLTDKGERVLACALPI